MAAGAFADAILAIRRDYPALAARAAAARGWLLAHRGYEGLADTVAAAIRTVVTPRCPDRPRAGVDPTLAADVAPDITPDAAPDARPDARPAPSIPMRTVLLLGPHLEAVSGISTHLRLLIGSPVGRHFRVRHFQVGSEGRTASRPQATGRGLTEGAFARLWRLAVSPWQLAAVLLRERPAIVHLNTAMDAKAFGRDLAYLLVACALRRRTVFQVHGGALPAEFTRGNPVLAALLRLAMRLPDQVVLLGRVERDAWQRFMPALSTRVIANAVETGESGEPVRSASSSYAQLRLVYLGRIVEAKGLFEALDAVCALHAHGLQPHFTIAGSGPDEARLREHAARLGIAAQVSFPGPVFGDAKARLWQQADVLVFPTWREGLPYSLLEAMAAGVVAITTPVGAIPEVITHGRDGLLVPPRDPVALAAAIRRVHDDRPAALAIAQAARRRVREAYSVERLATDFFGVYSRL
jgi:glycosyltransferase involved in cell wall biosynthesis